MSSKGSGVARRRQAPGGRTLKTHFLEPRHAIVLGGHRLPRLGRRRRGCSQFGARSVPVRIQLDSIDSSTRATQSLAVAEPVAPDPVNAMTAEISEPASNLTTEIGVRFDAEMLSQDAADALGGGRRSPLLCLKSRRAGTANRDRRCSSGSTLDAEHRARRGVARAHFQRGPCLSGARSSVLCRGARR